MPTPIGHALGGLLVGLVLARAGEAGEAGGAGRAGHESRVQANESNALGSKTTSALQPALPHGPGLPHAPDQPYPPHLALLALLACLPDVDFLWGRHNMETHSIGFAVLVGLAVLAWSRRPWLGLGGALAVGTHLLFDWLGSDDSPPLGIMALWPWTDTFYFADAYVFEAISRRYWLPGFFTHNLLAVLRELAILLPLALAAWFVARRRTRAV
jgi:membrane-bound metal-dependent hydrolase YbcI (DUF457 family)